MAVKISESLKKIIDVAEEKKGELRNKLEELSKKEKAIVMACIAPYVGKKVSPTRTLTAELGISEEFALETVIEQIKDKSDTSRLYLLLNSPGGFISSSYKVARAFRKSFKNIKVFVPHIAASGGTLVALTGNEIVMGMMSQLSPMDPTARDKGRNISAKGIVEGFEHITDFFRKTSEEDAPYTYKVLAEKYDAEQLDSAISTLMIMEDYTTEILEGSGYGEKARTIAHKLVRGFRNHGEVINYDKAKKVGLKVKKHSKYLEEWRLFREWLGEHLLRSADRHIIRYVIAEELRKIPPKAKPKRQVTAKN